MNKSNPLLLLFFMAALTTQTNAQILKPAQRQASNQNNDIATLIQQKANQAQLGKVHSESAVMRPTAGAGGYFLRYEKGWVYYNPSLKQAFAIYGDIMNKWAELGYETGQLGFPASDEMNSDKPDFKRMSKFDKGIIYWNDGRMDVVKNRFQIAVNNPVQKTAITTKSFSLGKILLSGATIDRASGISKYTKTYTKSNRQPKVEKSNDENCTTTYNTLSVSDIKQDVLSKSLAANIILGGAFQLSDFTQTGKMNVYEGQAIKPITLMLKSARLPEGKNAIVINDVTSSNLQTNLENLLERDANGKPTQNFVMSTTEVFSSKDFELKIGINLTGLGFNVEDAFKYDYSRKTQKYLVDFKNESFTAEAIKSANYFADDELNKNKSIVYVDKLTYGQRILVSYEEENKDMNVSNDLKASYAGQRINVDVKTKEKYKNIEFKMLAYGTNGEGRPFTVRGIESLANELNNFFKNALPTENRPAAFGAPISYSLRFLDGAVAIANARVEGIPVRNCTANENKDYNVTLKLDKMIGYGDAEMYGWIGVQCYKPNNEQLGEANNKNELIWNVDRNSANQNFMYTTDNSMTRSYVLSKQDIDNGAYLKIIYCPRERDNTSADDFFKLENTDETIKYKGGDYRVKKVLIKDYFNQSNNLSDSGFGFDNRCSDTGDAAVFSYIIKFK